MFTVYDVLACKMNTNIFDHLVNLHYSTIIAVVHMFSALSASFLIADLIADVSVVLTVCVTAVISGVRIVCVVLLVCVGAVISRVSDACVL